MGLEEIKGIEGVEIINSSQVPKYSHYYRTSSLYQSLLKNIQLILLNYSLPFVRETLRVKPDIKVAKKAGEIALILWNDIPIKKTL